MSSMVASILSALAASYDGSEVGDPTEEVPEPIVIGRNWTKDMVKAARGVPAERAKKEPTHQSRGRRETTVDNTGKALVTGLALPEVGSLQAKGFLKAMLNAGKRLTAEGLPFIDPSEVRHDQIKAIAGYCGFDNRLNFGEQELAAKSRAKLELNPITVNRDEPLVRNGAIPGAVPHTPPSVPDMLAARQANLEARERLAAESFIAHRKEFMDFKRTLDQRAQSKVMMDLEEQRLSQIRADLRLIPGYQG